MTILGTVSDHPLQLSPGLSFVSSVKVPNSRSIVYFFLVDFGKGYLLLFVVTGGKQSQLSPRPKLDKNRGPFNIVAS